jgi:hypothetical protein
VLGYSSNDGGLTRNGDDRKTQKTGATVGVAEEERALSHRSEILNVFVVK